MIDAYFDLLPSFLLIAIGYLLTKTKYFKNQWTDAMTSFVQLVAVPALMFSIFIEIEFSSLFNLNAIVSYYLGVVINFILIFIVFIYFRGRNGTQAALLTSGGTFSNNIFLGIPLAISLFGDQATLPMYVVIAFHAPLLISLQAILIGICKDKKAGHSRSKTIGLEIFANPIILATIASISLNLAGVSVDKTIILPTINNLASVTSTVALFAIGSALAKFSIKNSLLDNFILSSIKLLIFPIIVAFLSLVVFNVPKDLAKINIYLAALPTGLTPYIIAHSYACEKELNASTILVTTLISFFTISFVVSLFEYIV